MLILQLFLLIIIGFIGIMFNWLLILAIQRKTYHYQYSHRISSPTTNKSLLLPQPSPIGHNIQSPLLPSVRSSISTFDKFILAFLINDIFVCNFLLPLRFIDISEGLPCGFLCFILKFFEKLTTTIEIILINLLLITSLFYFGKKRILTTKLWLILILFMLPIFISCLLTTLAYIDVDEFESNNQPPTCKQTFIYINISTHETWNMFCCIVTYLIIFINFILLIKIQWSIKVYRKKALKSLTEAVLSTRNDTGSTEQTNYDHNNRRRSMYYSASLSTEAIAANTTPPVKRSIQPIDYLTYLSIIENSQTLVRSTCLILFIYSLVHIPYWLYEFFNTQLLYQLKDIFFLCHILKPFCYMLTNEKYRHHIWAILRCRTFRMLPNILRRKSRIMKLNNTHSFSIPNNY